MPELLSPAELNDFRKTIRDLAMPGTAHVLRGTSVPNGIGGYRQTLGTVSVGGTMFMPVRATISSPREREQMGQAIEAATWTITFPAEWDVRVTDRVYLFGMDRMMAVQGVMAPKTWELQRRVIATEERSNVGAAVAARPVPPVYPPTAGSSALDLSTVSGLSLAVPLGAV